jgi:hypothetical protein
LKEVQERFDRARETIKDNARELIETQSKVADMEEKLLITE